MSTHNVFDNNQCPCGPINDPIVDKLLGNAYQVVKYVAMNMPAIKVVSDEIASILAVYAKLKELSDIQAKIPELMEVQAALPHLEVLHTNLVQLLTLYTHIDELVKVATGIDDIHVITPHLQELATVAANITEVVATGINISKVIAVANSIASVNKLAPVVAEIDTLAQNVQALVNVNTHLPELLNINTHLPDLLNIETPLSKLVINSFEALRRTYAEAGLVLVTGSFEDGAKVTTKQDVVLERKTGKGYNWQGDIPSGGKVIPPDSTPVSAGGIGTGKWVDASAITLREPITAQIRESLRRSYAEAGFNLVSGGFYEGAKITNQEDVVLQSHTGDVFSWRGDIPSEGKYVSPGSDPASQGGVGPTAWQNISGISGSRFVDAKVFAVPGEADSTERLRYAIEYTSKKGLVLVISDEYYVNPIAYTKDLYGQDCQAHALTTMNGTCVVFAGKGKIKSLPTSADRYVIWLVRHNGANIWYPVIEGDRDTHITTPSTDPNNYDGFSGEWGFGMYFDSTSADIDVIKPKVTKCWGDSYIINTNGHGIRLHKPYGAFSRRQGVSIISGSGIRIVDPVMEDISGTWPSAGIDFEMDSSGQNFEVLVSNFKSRRCRGYALDLVFKSQSSSSKPCQIVIDGSIDTDGEIHFQSFPTLVRNQMSFTGITKCKRVIHDAMNPNDLITIDNLVSDENIKVNISKRSTDPAVSDIGVLKVNTLSLPATVTRPIYVEDPDSNLTAATFTRHAVVIHKVVLPRGTNMPELINPQGRKLRAYVGDINSKANVTDTVTTLYLNSLRAVHTIVDRSTQTTVLKVDPLNFLNGTSRVVEVLRGSVVVSPTSQATVNRSVTDLPAITAPCRLVFSSDDTGNNYLCTNEYVLQ